MSANSENSEKTNVENKAETEIKPAESVIKDEKPAFVDINKVVEPEKPKEKPVSTKEVKEINIKSEIKTENDGKRTESKKKGALFWAGVSIGVVGTIFAVTRKDSFPFANNLYSIIFIFPYLHLLNLLTESLLLLTVALAHFSLSKQGFCRHFWAFPCLCRSCLLAVEPYTLFLA